MKSLFILSVFMLISVVSFSQTSVYNYNNEDDNGIVYQVSDSIISFKTNIKSVTIVKKGNVWLDSKNKKYAVITKDNVYFVSKLSEVNTDNYYYFSIAK